MNTKTPDTVVKLDSLSSGDSAEWVDLDDLPGVSLLVRPIDYPAYTQARQLLFKRLGRTYRENPIPETVLVPALGVLYARHLLVGWKGFDVEFSQEDAEAKLGDWQWRKITRQVEWAAARLTAITAEMVETAGKNSAPPSGTT